MPWHVYLPHGQRKIDPLLYTEKCGTLGPALNISLSELDRRARSTMYMESPPLPSPPNFPPKSSHAKLILGDLGPRNRWHRLHRSLWTNHIELQSWLVCPSGRYHCSRSYPLHGGIVLFYYGVLAGGTCPKLEVLARVVHDAGTRSEEGKMRLCMLSVLIGASRPGHLVPLGA